jgi:hypothetical protein
MATASSSTKPVEDEPIPRLPKGTPRYIFGRSCSKNTVLEHSLAVV